VARVFTYRLHCGEEPPLSAGAGSGTIFFSGCNLRCVYCQNHPFSQQGRGHPVRPGQIAEMMLRLQDQGCANINLVTATHVLPPVLAGIRLAVRNGLRVPIVYNTNGYESPRALALLDGVVDIYLPDMRHADPAPALRWSRAPNYVEVNGRAILEMWRQTGPLETLDGTARRGLIIRHLVLPGALDQTRRVLRWIRRNLGARVAVSLMLQYTPAFKAANTPHHPLGRTLRPREQEEALQCLLDEGLLEGWVQDPPDELTRRHYLGAGFTPRHPPPGRRGRHPRRHKPRVRPASRQARRPRNTPGS
jgi:putative pyruvate formate lyase activating enzyme